MAKKKKAVEQETNTNVTYDAGHITVIKPTLDEDNIVKPKEVFEEEITDAMSKAQELMNNAVNEVLDGIISKKELLNIAIRKVRATSVLSVEEDDALGKMHIEVKVWF